MKRTLSIVFFATTAALFVSPGDARACGDKLVAIGGGISFERIAGNRPTGDIVLFVAPDSAPDAKSRAEQLRSVLARAGHRVQIVNGAEELHRVLKADNPDLVLTSLADANHTILATEHPSGLPAVLHLRYRDTGTVSIGRAACEVNAEQRRGRQVVQAVSELLRQRDEGKPMDCGPAS